ncbi:tyrosine-type recombinase/integrase [Oscillibacter valericigenes]|uniref:tyrosine-type recombinase/integrase n=1 Tax=Oscillibacter valericigenes TaxID=351091 RepID=UPI001958AC0E|nr:tyrosine-type recombinase/integrase [Oscillibacter valericigenes]MBM6911340.1 tyrosine-type recombinase/integrase [Oscillibacter valericigenes]
MAEHRLTPLQIHAFARHLLLEEKSAATIEKYLRNVRAFAGWLDGQEITKERNAAWKAHLVERGYAPAGINAKLSALSSLLEFLGLRDCRVKFLKVQRRLFRDAGRELTKAEYQSLLDAAHRLGRDRLGLLVEAIGATGIRVSEVRYLTVEAARQGKAEISLKGKVRVILLPGKLCRKLLRYAEKQKTASGAIFRTKSGREMSRRQIWAEMKRLCKYAGVEPGKVFPHNLRHLFATVFYRACRDIVRLSDLLGHSSIETTRIYLVTSGAEHQRTLERLGLIS